MTDSADREEPQGPVIVEEEPSFKWSHFLTKEDSWSIWLGFALLIIGLLIYLPRPPEDAEKIITQSNAVMKSESEAAPFKTIEWYRAYDAKTQLKANSEPYGRWISKALGEPHSWQTNPIKAFFQSESEAEQRNAEHRAAYERARASADSTLAVARQKQQAAAEAEYADRNLNQQARTAIEQWRSARTKEAAARKKVSSKPYNQIGYLAGLCVFLALFFGIGVKFMGRSYRKFVLGFPFVFLIAVLSYMFESQSTMNEYGIGYAAWAIVIGLLISNTVGTPNWVKPAVQTEFYIKTGLVLLGAELLFGKIVAIGIPGIFVAWLVTPIVLISGYILGNKVFKLQSKSLNITVSAAFSVCGVSAAIATAAASRAKKEELTLAVGMSLIFTSIMMIVMPNFIKVIGMGEILGGAWMGGTIDSTGAVAAAGAFLGDKALYVAATVKMIQNILIGLVAFGVAIFWCLKVDVGDRGRVRSIELWYRLPKFVLGFAAASIVFSLIYEVLGRDTAHYAIDHGVIRGCSKQFRGWFFCLAFVSIGLESNFRELARYFKGGKLLMHYVVGQSWNVILTLIIAYLAFFVLFPHITASI